VPWVPVDAWSTLAVVDLGCGSGEILSALTGQFEQRVGRDVSHRRLHEMARGLCQGWQFCESDLNQPFPLADGSADAVIANQVVEHIIDPFHFAREIHAYYGGVGAV